MESLSSSKKPNEFVEFVQRLEQRPAESRLVAAYEFVRDISYGDIGSRNPFDVLIAKKGTCSGKHALLKLLLTELGYEVQNWFAKHDFGKFPITEWPPELSEFKSKIIPDYHDFLKVKTGDDWLVVDAVFEKELSKLGFPKLEWDGKTDVLLPVETSEIFVAEEDVEAHKKRLIEALPEAQQDDRKRFLSALTNWLDSQREAIK